MADIDLSDDAIRTLIDQRLDEIADPCAMAQGLSLGISAMGLLHHVEIDRADGLKLVLYMRTTSPNCLFFTYFHLQVPAVLGEAGFDDVELRWEVAGQSWSPDDMKPEARVHAARLRLRSFKAIADHRRPHVTAKS